MAGGSQQTSTQTTSSAPWGAAQPYLKKAMKKAGNFLEDKRGFNPYPGQAYVPFSGETESALSGITNLANQGNPFYGGARDFTQGLIGGQFNADTSGFRGLLGNVDSEFENVVQTTANDLGDQIQRQFGGASYGAPENASYLTKGVGDVVSRMRSDNFFNRQNLQRGLLGDIANLEQQDIGNRMAGVGMAPGVYDMQYAPFERLADVGAAREGKAGEILQADMDRWNIKEMAPFDRLTQAFGIFSGSGAQGNRSTSSVSQPTDIWSKLLGGGLLGSQLFF